MEKACERTIESPAGRWMAAAWLPVAAYMALIFYLSSLPHPDEQLPKVLFETLGDKLLHAIEYVVLAALSYRAFRRAAGPHAARYAVVYAAAAASFYGVSDEVHQAFVPFRTATWLDWLADTAGGILGSLTAQRVMERRAKDAIS
jgi:VanZ family protein